MKQLFRASKQPQLNEISQYVEDIEKVSVLRDEAKISGTELELAEYENTLNVMRKVLLHLNERVK